MRVRLWMFTERFGTYPEGGTYDTSVFDDDTGNCSDARQFVEFERLMEWANDNGEVLQEVSSPDEAYSLCSQARVRLLPTTCGDGGYSTSESTLIAAVSRPPASRCGVVLPMGGGARYSAPPQQSCPPPEPIIPPSDFSSPQIMTLSDQARRIIRLAKQNPVVPTIIY